MRLFIILFLVSLVFPDNCNMELIGSLEFDQELSDITGFYQDGREFAVVGLSGEHVPGCNDLDACNYDPDATHDDGSCTYPTATYLNCDDSCINNSNSDGVCDLSLFNGLIPEDYSVHSIYLNPFNPVTNITYGLLENVNVQIIVYDLSGKHVETLINQLQTPGYYSINWNASSYPSGVYLIRMESVEFAQTQKVVLVK